MRKYLLDGKAENHLHARKEFDIQSITAINCFLNANHFFKQKIPFMISIFHHSEPVILIRISVYRISIYMKLSNLIQDVKMYDSLEMKMAFVSSFNARMVSMIVFKKYENLSKVLIKLVTECKKINLVKTYLAMLLPLK